VIDNGSTDQTPAVLASFADRLPLCTVSEPTVGKNSALNAGLVFIEGDLAVFTDDDSFPKPDWLVELRRAADTELEYAMFGGAVVPRWQVPPPAWVQWVEQGPVYTLTDPLMKAGPMPPFLVFGPNMAIRTALFQAGVRFDPSIGPRNTSYPMGSETELTLRLSKEGYKAWYVPTAVVAHFIREDQMCESWVMKRAIKYGRGSLRLNEHKAFVAHPWFGVPRRLFREIFEEERTVIRNWLTSNPRELFRARWKRNFLWGQMIEARFLDGRRRAETTKRPPSIPEAEAAPQRVLTGR
jgi:glycosyltransferase involved in cell wall biosynthesis